MVVLSHPRSRVWATAVALTLLVSTFMASGPAAAGPFPPPPPPPPPGVILDVDAKAVLDWSVPKRYSGSWSAYSPQTGTYDGDFVNPLLWRITVDGCRSTAVRRIELFTFKVEQYGGAWATTVNSSSCTAAVNTLPGQGLYKVTLTLRTDWGVVDGVSYPTSTIASIRDYLIVTMGDSLSSGEGNPDAPGDYIAKILKPWELLSLEERRPVRWLDRRCHRSTLSGPALAAQAFEDADPKTSVTYVNLACSGAELGHLIDQTYGGMEEDGVVLQGQVQAVASLFGDQADNGQRRIDALTMTAGLNDLDFSAIVKKCSTNVNLSGAADECVTSGGIADKLATLPAKYDRLAAAISTFLPGTREVYLSDYPSSVFKGGGCGLLGTAGIGITEVEESAMHHWGDALNGVIRTKVLQYDSDAFRWNFADSLSQDFGAHAYCSSAPWFTSLERSLGTQGDMVGTAHPNRAGHVQFGAILRADVVPNQVSVAHRQLTVTIEALKVKRMDGFPDMRVDTVMFKFQNDYVGEARYLMVPRSGEWTAVPKAQGTFTLSVFAAPASPRHAVEVAVMLGHILPIHHRAADGYGVGTHVLENVRGGLAVRYTVASRIPQDPVGP